MQMRAGSQDPKGHAGAPDRLSSPLTMCWPFLELVDLGRLIKIRWPEKFKKKIRRPSYPPFPPGASLLTLKSSLSCSPSLPRASTGFCPRQALLALYEMEQAPQACCHHQGPKNILWVLVPGIKSTVGNSQGGPTGGMGTLCLHLWNRLQVALRKMRHQVSPAARRSRFWAFLSGMATDRRGRGVNGFLTGPCVFNQCFCISCLWIRDWLCLDVHSCLNNSCYRTPAVL